MPHLLQFHYNLAIMRCSTLLFNRNRCLFRFLFFFLRLILFFVFDIDLLGVYILPLILLPFLPRLLVALGKYILPWFQFEDGPSFDLLFWVILILHVICAIFFVYAAITDLLALHARLKVSRILLGRPRCSLLIFELRTIERCPYLCCFLWCCIEVIRDVVPITNIHAYFACVSPWWCICSLLFLQFINIISFHLF